MVRAEDGIRREAESRYDARRQFTPMQTIALDRETGGDLATLGGRASESRRDSFSLTAFTSMIGMSLM